MPEAEYRNWVKEHLERLYPQVETPWYPFDGEGPGIYAPESDVAVGPFAIHNRFIDEYTSELRRSKQFIDMLVDCHNSNVVENEDRVSFDSLLHFNDNARCLLCFEIEASGGRKHCLGNLINASALGRVGILVSRNLRTQRIFLRQRKYLRYLADVGKNTFKTENALILTEQQLNDCLEQIENRG